jgi:hypothetical protein
MIYYVGLPRPHCLQIVNTCEISICLQTRVYVPLDSPFPSI